MNLKIRFNLEMSAPKIRLKIVQAHELLGVTSESTEKEITKAYHKLAVKNHPDKFLCESEKAAAQERFIKIKAAYELLLNGSDSDDSPEFQKPVEVEVCGIIVRATSRTSKTFTVSSETGQRTVCSYSGFMPMRQGDAIVGIGIIQGKNVVFQKTPFIVPGVDRETLLDVVYLALRGAKFYRGKAEEIVNLLIVRAGDSEGACILMDRLAAFTNYSSETDLTDLNIGNIDPYIAFSNLIDPKQFAKLMSYWYKQRVLRKLYLLGLTNTEIKESRTNPVLLYDKVLSNPYLIPSIKLEKCEDILNRCGIRVSKDYKECGKIVRKISEIMDRGGWTGIPSKRLKSLFPKIQNYLPMLKSEFGLVGDMHTVYLDFAYEAEVGVAEWTQELLSRPANYQATEAVFTRDDLSEGQQSAVQKALTNNLSIVTGPGGSGKTHVIKELCYNLERQGIGYKLASFTGKAVARIREVTGSKEASTLNLMITMQNRKEAPTWRHLIIDEASMVTTELLHQFRKKFSHNFSITLVGDANQLPPISWGSYFNNLILTGKVPTVRLNKVFRTVESDRNGILINSRRIINHADPDYNGPDFSFEITNNFKILVGDLDMVEKLVNMLLNNGISHENTVIVSPYNRDLDRLNQMCSEKFNGLHRAVTDHKGKNWRVGDRVMHTQNNYQHNLMNGYEGIIIDVSNEWVTVKYGESTYRYLTGLIPEDLESSAELYIQHLTHSFACSVHRLQGSEADFVIGYIPETSATSNFLNRNLLYTLITRAKKCIWLVGDPETMERAATTSPAWRCENLIQRINNF